MFHLKNHPAIGDPPFYEQKKASQKPWDTEGSHMEIIGFNPSPIRFHLFNLVIFRDQRWIYWMVHWIGLRAYFMGKTMLSGVGFPTTPFFRWWWKIPHGNPYGNPIKLMLQIPWSDGDLPVFRSTCWAAYWISSRSSWSHPGPDSAALVRRGAKAAKGARTLGLDMLRHKCSYITMYNMGYILYIV